MSSSLAFLSYTRQGLASQLTTTTTVGGEARAHVPVTFTLSGASPGAVDVTLLGPGDITGLDKRAVIRAEPSHLSRNFEPNYFPFVELDRPDLPWLFTPKGPASSGDHRILPWLCLVVVPADKATLETSGARPVLTVDPIQLPRLDQAWAWAHVQVAGYATGESIQTIVETAPERICSRLICPRKLDTNTAYIACLVPTFEAGRLAGLPDSKPEGTEGLQPAWSTPEVAGSSVQLPVYYYYEFSTGQAGDFESLVRKLTPQVLANTVGVKTVDISDPGSGIGPLDAEHPMSVVKLVGALKAPATELQVVDDPDDSFADYQEDLQTLLNLGAGLESDVVTPPLYGRWHGMPFRTPLSGESSPDWLLELNLSPWHRAAAGIGSRVVEVQQRALMASAWDQAEDLEAVNHARARSGLAARLNQSKHRRWFKNTSMTWGRALQISGPSHARLVPPGGQSVLSQLETTRFPVAASSRAMRKLSRARGPLARRANLAHTQNNGFDDLCDKFEDGTALSAASERAAPQGMVTLGTVVAAFLAQHGAEYGLGELPFTIDDLELDELESTGEDYAEEPDLVPSTRNSSEVRGSWTDDSYTSKLGPFALAFAQVVGHLRDQLANLVRPEDNRPLLSASSEPTSGSLFDALKGLNIAGLIQTRLEQRVAPVEGLQLASRPFARALVGPVFPQPMYEALRDLNPELLLAGASQIPANSVGLLETNRAFIEAYMVGLNHAMSRELLWNAYPTNLRATYFSQFWDAADADPDEGSETVPADISAINAWSHSSNLGEHDPSSTQRALGGDKVVLLVRGELLQRYPLTVVYAAKAESPSHRLSASAEQRYPIFRATLGADITCLGFDLTLDEALGEDEDSPEGWYFVLEEHAAQARFGLDNPASGNTQFGLPIPANILSWNGLTWAHVVNTSQQFDALTNIDLVQSSGLNPNPPPISGLDLQSVTWGKNAASMAQIAFQKPVRVAIHATDLIGE